jgi:hypothetical protein
MKLRTVDTVIHYRIPDAEGSAKGREKSISVETLSLCGSGFNSRLRDTYTELGKSFPGAR